MNFFEQQELARKKTRLLIALFIVAVCAIVLILNSAIALLILAKTNHTRVPLLKNILIVSTLITVGGIGGAILYKIQQLREGGNAIAQMMGGRLIRLNTSERQEKILINVVEEMALAAGMTCPRIYLLDHEEGINAFAAGFSPNAAIIAVTQGTLHRLTRDELQGVIGHEFSHILNGDMKLNMHLIGILFGIEAIGNLGRAMMSSVRSNYRSNDRSSYRKQVDLLGLILFVIGYVGLFFGRLIKAAISKQREFLADASAIQFTRNPEGIGNALRKIGGLSKTLGVGSQVTHPRSEELSHLFLGPINIRSLDGWFATHPSIQERLKRIYRRTVSLLDAPELNDDSAASIQNTPSTPLPEVVAGFNATNTASPTSSAKEPALSVAKLNVLNGKTALLPQLDRALHTSHDACAVIYALLLEKDPKRHAEQEQQLAILRTELPDQINLITTLLEAVQNHPHSARLSLIDLATPALKELTHVEKINFLKRVNQLILADKKITLSEFVIQVILENRLGNNSERAIPVKFFQLSSIKKEVAYLLSLVTHVSTPSTQSLLEQRFLRGAHYDAKLNLTIADMTERAAIQLPLIKQSLERANQLAPLIKPILMKLLLAAAIDEKKGEHLSVMAADILRAICAALDMPAPPVITQTYIADCVQSE